MFETCTEDEHLIGRLTCQGWILPCMIAVAGATVRHGDDANLAALFRQGAHANSLKSLDFVSRLPHLGRLGAHPAAERAGRSLHGIGHGQRGDRVGTPRRPLLCFGDTPCWSEARSPALPQRPSGSSRSRPALHPAASLLAAPATAMSSYLVCLHVPFVALASA